MVWNPSHTSVNFCENPQNRPSALPPEQDRLSESEQLLKYSECFEVMQQENLPRQDGRNSLIESLVLVVVAFSCRVSTVMDAVGDTLVTSHDGLEVEFANPGVMRGMKMTVQMLIVRNMAVGR